MIPTPTEAEKQRWLRAALRKRKIEYEPWEKNRDGDIVIRKCSEGCGRVVARRNIRCYDCAERTREEAQRKRWRKGAE